MCPEALLVIFVRPDLSLKNSVSMIRSPDAPKAKRDPQIPPDAKIKVQRNVS
jgi:hypothetical protein